MGAGKTSMGAAVAKRLGIRFIDTDDYIALMQGSSVKQLIENQGEGHFRKLEKNALLSIMKDNDRKIIATGGGMPCYEDNMERMKSSGYTIYLEWPLDVLHDRIKNSIERPLIQLNKDRLKSFLKEELNKRESIYKCADLTLEMPSVESLYNSILSIP